MQIADVAKTGWFKSLSRLRLEELIQSLSDEFNELRLILPGGHRDFAGKLMIEFDRDNRELLRDVRLEMSDITCRWYVLNICYLRLWSCELFQRWMAKEYVEYFYVQMVKQTYRNVFLKGISGILSDLQAPGGSLPGVLSWIPVTFLTEGMLEVQKTLERDPDNYTNPLKFGFMFQDDIKEMIPYFQNIDRHYLMNSRCIVEDVERFLKERGLIDG